MGTTNKTSRKLASPSFYTLFTLLVVLLSVSVFGASDWNGVNNGQLGNTQKNIYYASFNNSLTEYNFDTDIYSLNYAPTTMDINLDGINELFGYSSGNINICLLYTSPSPRD